jgi:hypothetical protein
MKPYETNSIHLFPSQILEVHLPLEHLNFWTTLKTLFVSLVRPNLEYASTSVWSPHQACHSERIERIQHNFVRYALRMLHWTADPLPACLDSNLWKTEEQ